MIIEKKFPLLEAYCKRNNIPVEEIIRSSRVSHESLNGITLIANFLYYFRWTAYLAIPFGALVSVFFPILGIIIIAIGITWITALRKLGDKRSEREKMLKSEQEKAVRFKEHFQQFCSITGVSKDAAMLLSTEDLVEIATLHLRELGEESDGTHKASRERSAFKAHHGTHFCLGLAEASWNKYYPKPV